MRILRLTQNQAASILAARRRRDRGAERVAARIVADVRRRGDMALLAWSRRLDGASFSSAQEIWVRPRDFHQAKRAVPPALLRAIEHAARNIRRVAEQQKPRPWMLEVEPGVSVSQIVRPLGTVGCYVPGGRFALVSTLLMTAIPAQVAGVRRIVVTCPRPNAAVLAAANLLGLFEVARVGGAQAIAALAYGTRTIARVDKICGPGNRFVTAAKRLVSHDCAIDMLAGPTELLVLATSGEPRFIAADLVAQAEHDPDATALLVTPSRRLAQAVGSETQRQLLLLAKSNPARRSLARNGAILVARTLEEAVAFANRFAPEHLSLPGSEQEFLKRVEAAGSVFLGPWSAQPLGDYATGSNHTLPTSAWARARGGLSAADFVKCISIQKISRRGFLRLAPLARALADAELLAAHGRAVEVRK
ncbi:MAG: histidinol dehydrogenase [Candidatus Acidiferrales bacterium]